MPFNHFGFTDAELALTCGRHGGESIHVDAVTSMLAKVGMAEADLRCGVHMPDYYGENNLPPRGSVFDQRHHNCCIWCCPRRCATCCRR